MTIVCRILDFLHLHIPFQLIWHLLTGVSVLKQSEIEAASLVLGASSLRYEEVRVAEGRLLGLIFRLNGGRAFTLFHTINLPKSGSHSRPHLDIIVHELVHVRQFKLIGSLYIWQALRAQWGEGYGYGGWQQLEIDRASGRHFRDYNREQQGQIAQDYYNLVVAAGLPPEDPVSQAYRRLLKSLKTGSFKKDGRGGRI